MGALQWYQGINPEYSEPLVEIMWSKFETIFAKAKRYVSWLVQQIQELENT